MREVEIVMNYGLKIVFEYDKFFNKINMKLIADDQIVFYEEVTNDVIDVVEEYKKNNY